MKASNCRLFLIAVILMSQSYIVGQKSATGLGLQISSLGGGVGIRHWTATTLGYEGYISFDIPEGEYLKDDVGSSLLSTFGGKLMHNYLTVDKFKYYGGIDLTYRHLTIEMSIPTGVSSIPYIDMDGTGNRFAAGALVGVEVLNTEGNGAYCAEIGYYTGEIEVQISNNEYDFEETSTFSDNGLYWSLAYRHYFW